MRTWCNKIQTCNICEATFKMELGCNLEKRCPACRFLKLSKKKDKYQPFMSLDVRDNLEAVDIDSLANHESIYLNYLDENVAAKEETAVILERWLKYRLNEKQYAVLMLNIYHEFSPTEISKMLKINRYHVVNIISTAKHMLKHPHRLRLPGTYDTIREYVYNDYLHSVSDNHLLVDNVAEANTTF